MGWQARLPKNQKECYEKSCPKCGGTGSRGKMISSGGYPVDITVKCSCTVRNARVGQLAESPGLEPAK